MKDHKQWVNAIFDKAASKYGEKSSSFFSYFGKRLVEQVKVHPHHRVLDVATGRGAVLFPLTEMISHEGSLIGIDISKEMVKETSRELIEREIDCVKIIQMDAESLCFSDNTFDFVFCGFAIFFLPSISKALAEFKRVLKPEGSLVVSIWGDDSNLDDCVNNEVHRFIRPQGLAATPIWDGPTLQVLLENADYSDVQIREETKTFVHESAEEWYNSLWNHGTRAKLEQLSLKQQIQLRDNVLRKASELAIENRLEENLQVFYGVAKKPLLAAAGEKNLVPS